MDSAVVAKSIAKRFGKVEVLKDISFAIPAGQTVCILGGSGGGKSTLLKVLIGVLKPTSGEVLIDNQEMHSLKRRARDKLRLKFGVMFQNGALFNSMTVAENVALPLEHHTKLDSDTISTVVKMKLQFVDLLHAADRRPSEISGGMQKRAAVARSLALDPKIMFFDEPSAGLDPIATARIDQLINRLKSSMGITNIVVTHVMASVRRIADRVIMLHVGTVLLDGSLDDLLESTDPKVRQFVEGDLESLAEESERKSFYRDLLVE